MLNVIYSLFLKFFIDFYVLLGVGILRMIEVGENGNRIEYMFFKLIILLK